MGGRKNRHYVDTEPINIAPSSTPEEVKNLLAQAMVDVLAKKIDPRIASTITYRSGAPFEILRKYGPATAGRPTGGSIASKGGQVMSTLWKRGRCSKLPKSHQLTAPELHITASYPLSGGGHVMAISHLNNKTSLRLRQRRRH
jgi:hypothetical protein